ncbi:SDR family oxidoreductase [Lentzea tibetensis]|uniref:SDR family oxidoreductase n=1 Tax=Lentzea tibetensis TaxID=2591470 RepID=A0A563ESY5_9PSEU|nr:SDR family oxidoreductase [Lentzea tibetensis]TWP50648.1 SDR family oxidoreductase [Lentzea tibetensis]
MLLEDRNAIIYGGGGQIGGAIARAFAREGARVHLTGRTRTTLEKVADDIRAQGGRAETAEVDALDEAAVDAHADAVARDAGGIDISLSVIADGDVQGTPVAGMSLDDYLRPVTTAVTSKFLTARAAARHMIPRRSGVIMMFGGTGNLSAIRDYHVGGFLTALDAAESLRRQLAVELGRYGIRVVTLRTSGVPETLGADFLEREAIERLIVDPTLLGRAATLEDVGNVAVFAASDWARTLTGTAINMTCGADLD